MKNPEERMQELDNAIREAEIEVGLRRKQLSELRPKRQEYEQQSVDMFGVPISELSTYINKQEQNTVVLLEKLEEELKSAGQVI